MSAPLSITLIITTYNWPEALELVLLSVLKQSHQPNEIIIADDGSTHETKEIIDLFNKILDIPIIHVWHEDIGFTKTVILNKALKKVASVYIIQIDGDVILHKHFIRDHFNNIQQKTFLFGSRTSLNQEYSTYVLKNKKISFHWLNKGLLRRVRAIRIPFYKLFNKQSWQNSKKLRGCNMSYWKKDASLINGYDEDLIGWGYEDSEFSQRLLNTGTSSLRIKHCAIQYHIYHKEAPKGNTKIGNAIVIRTLKEKVTKCKNGIIKL